ncbi:CPBP family intramembrane glutamic endopeptidase [Alkalihalobacterium bogoriense]|uniref:CPBP family intramembrane glutamic endopeptidase n=1 Tax=Alkalihalobacterium bogoriense TaxID=246272 RepID=UPI00047C30A4|nr:CPBP family intramembrane glutamic endopeptidase [Alkalihalobacterium bogoriense]
MGSENNFHEIKTLSLTVKIIVLFAITLSVFLTIELTTGNDMNNLFNITIHILLIILIIRSLKKHHISIKSVIGSLSIQKHPWLQLISMKIFLFIFSTLSIVAILYVIGLVDSTFYRDILLEENSEIIDINRMIVTLVIGITLVPIMEELFFRGFLLNKWGERIGVTKAVMLSSLVFGILHFDSGFIGSFVSGIFYSFVYIKSKTLLVPIILHSFHNLLALSLEFIPDGGTPINYEDIPQSINEMQLVFSIGTLIFLILIPIVCYVLYRYNKGSLKVTPYQNNKLNNVTS